MIIEHHGKKPIIHPTAYIAPNAVISGDVTIGANSRILYGAVVTAEGAPVRIGEGVVIMENAVVRASGGKRRRFPTTLGDYVMIGPHAYVSGATLEYRAFVATNGVVFDGARIGRNAAVAIGAIVHIQTRVPDETVVPLAHIVIGDPCKLYAPNQADEIIDELMRRNFRDYVFGLREEQILAEYYSRSLGIHINDRVLELAESISEAPVETTTPEPAGAGIVPPSAAPIQTSPVTKPRSSSRRKRS